MSVGIQLSDKQAKQIALDYIETASKNDLVKILNLVSECLAGHSYDFTAHIKKVTARQSTDEYHIWEDMIDNMTIDDKDKYAKIQQQMLDAGEW